MTKHDNEEAYASVVSGIGTSALNLGWVVLKRITVPNVSFIQRFLHNNNYSCISYCIQLIYVAITWRTTGQFLYFDDYELNKNIRQ